MMQREFASRIKFLEEQPKTEKNNQEIALLNAVLAHADKWAQAIRKHYNNRHIVEAICRASREVSQANEELLDLKGAMLSQELAAMKAALVKSLQKAHQMITAKRSGIPVPSSEADLFRYISNIGSLLAKLETLSDPEKWIKRGLKGGTITKILPTHEKLSSLGEEISQMLSEWDKALRLQRTSQMQSGIEAEGFENHKLLESEKNVEWLREEPKMLAAILARHYTKQKETAHPARSRADDTKDQKISIPFEHIERAPTIIQHEFLEGDRLPIVIADPLASDPCHAHPEAGCITINAELFALMRSAEVDQLLLQASNSVIQFQRQNAARKQLGDNSPATRSKVVNGPVVAATSAADKRTGYDIQSAVFRKNIAKSDWIANAFDYRCWYQATKPEHATRTISLDPKVPELKQAVLRMKYLHGEIEALREQINAFNPAQRAVADLLFSDAVLSRAHYCCTHKRDLSDSSRPPVPNAAIQEKLKTALATLRDDPGEECQALYRHVAHAPTLMIAALGEDADLLALKRMHNPLCAVEYKDGPLQNPTLRQSRAELFDQVMGAAEVDLKAPRDGHRYAATVHAASPGAGIAQ